MENSKLITKSGKPLRITSRMGIRKHPITGATQSFHNGNDYSLANKSEMVAPFDGVVTRADANAVSYGGYIMIYSPTLNVTSLYAHMFRLDVKVGQSVKKGQVVGLSGGLKGQFGSGDSTGPHAHWALLRGKQTTGMKQPRTVFIDSETFDFTEVKLIPEKYSFISTSDTNINIRTEPNQRAKVVGQVKKGEKIDYFAKAETDNHVWLAFTLKGETRYIACRTFENGKRGELWGDLVPTTAQIKVGDKVIITASKYATGQRIPSWVRKRTHTVEKITGDRVLLKEIKSWVMIDGVKKS